MSPGKVLLCPLYSLSLFRCSFHFCFRSLVDTVYALKDEVQELRQDNKKMKKSLEEEQRARKDLEKLVRRVLKNMNDPAWDETNL